MAVRKPTPPQQRLMILLGLRSTGYQPDNPLVLQCRRPDADGVGEYFIISRDGKIVRGENHLTIAERSGYQLHLQNEQVWQRSDPAPRHAVHTD